MQRIPGGADAALLEVGPCVSADCSSPLHSKGLPGTFCSRGIFNTTRAARIPEEALTGT